MGTVSDPMPRAIIYLRELRPDCRCPEYAAERGYRLSGVVVDPDGTRYPQLLDGAIAGQTEVILTCAMSDLPQDRIPRVEVCQSRPVPADDAGATRPHRRRPRRVA